MAKIMIVDDSSLIRKTLKDILEKAGHLVIAEAIDGNQAILEYEIKRPDLVTMDINMPGLNGIETVKRIIEKDPYAKIVIISSVNQKNMVFDALQNGAKHYIVKPINYDKVIDVIEIVLKEDFEDDDLQNKSKEVIAEDPVTILNIENGFKLEVKKIVDTDMVNILNGVLKGVMFSKPSEIVFELQKGIKDEETDELFEILLKKTIENNVKIEVIR